MLKKTLTIIGVLGVAATGSVFAGNAVGVTASDQIANDAVRANWNAPLAERIESLDQSIAQHVDSFDSAEAAFASCMQSTVPSYQAQQIDIVVNTDDGDLLDRGESLRLHGYGIADGEGSRGIAVTLTTPASEHSIGVTDEVLDDAAAQCGPSSLIDDLQESIVLAHDRLASLPESVTESGPVKKGLSRWSACMADAGFDLAQPTEAFDFVEQEMNKTKSPAEAAELELRVASIDADCFDATVVPVIDLLLE